MPGPLSRCRTPNVGLITVAEHQPPCIGRGEACLSRSHDTIRFCCWHPRLRTVHARRGRTCPSRHRVTTGDALRAGNGRRKVRGAAAYRRYRCDHAWNPMAATGEACGGRGMPSPLRISRPRNPTPRAETGASRCAPTYGPPRAAHARRGHTSGCPVRGDCLNQPAANASRRVGTGPRPCPQLLPETMPGQG